MIHDIEDDLEGDAKFADCWTTIYSRRVFNGSEKEEIWKKHRGRCAYCNKRLTRAKAEFDHIHPFIKGGVSTATNGALSCRSCNRAKIWRDKNLPYDASVLFFRKIHRTIDRYEELNIAYKMSRIDFLNF
jgi:hypothetical protein